MTNEGENISSLKDPAISHMQLVSDGQGDSRQSYRSLLFSCSTLQSLQSPYGLHMDSTQKMAFTGLESSPVQSESSPVQFESSPVQSTFFSLKLSLKSNDIYIILQYFLS